jgi:peptide/nickel transport system ATP-binding protein
MTPLLELRGLRVTIGAREILRGVDLSVAPGEALGLVGESGSGKTTLGRTMVRLIAPSGGALLLDGREIGALRERELRPLRARMQMIFQDPQSALNPRLTIGTSLARPSHAFGRPSRVAELLQMVGLPLDFRSRYPHELSGGQRQRVGIARALAVGPELIVADEIVSGLDVSTQAQILLLLRRLRAELGLTLVFVSHNLSVVRVLCQTIAVLEGGRIVEHGAVEEVFAAPAHPVTQALLQAVPLPDPDPHWLA